MTHSYDMTHSHVCHDSLHVCVLFIHSYVCHDPFILKCLIRDPFRCVPWLITCMCNWMSHGTHVKRHVTHMNDTHTWMSHVTHMNESCHTREWVMSHTWMSHVTHMNESNAHATNTYAHAPSRPNTSSCIFSFCGGETSTPLRTAPALVFVDWIGLCVNLEKWHSFQHLVGFIDVLSNELVCLFNVCLCLCAPQKIGHRVNSFYPTKIY